MTEGVVEKKEEMRKRRRRGGEQQGMKEGEIKERLEIERK